MLAVVIGLCLIWIILATVGLLVKTLAWLAIVGFALLVLTIAGGAIHAMMAK